MKQLFKGIALGAALLSAQPVLAADRELLNTSYDIARELFAAYNEEFKKHWQEKTGETVEIKQSHAGSSKQAQAIIQGLKADVATFNQVTDIDILHQRGRLIPEDWADRLPNNSSPYYSTMAFLVREGNPKVFKISGFGVSGNPRVFKISGFGFSGNPKVFKIAGFRAI